MAVVHELAQAFLMQCLELRYRRGVLRQLLLRTTVTLVVVAGAGAPLLFVGASLFLQLLA